MLKTLGATAGVLGLAHGVLTCGALTRSLLRSTDSVGQNPPEGPAKPLSDAPAAVRTVVDMYSKCHVDEAAFSPHVTFEDPAALTVGIAELQEAFRALGALQPENLGWKLASSDGSTRVTEVDIWQRYIIGTRPVELYARVQVTCGSNGRIVSLKDLWNGTELLMPPPFPYVRRINGAVSSVVTPMLIRNNNPTADD